MVQVTQCLHVPRQLFERISELDELRWCTLRLQLATSDEGIAQGRALVDDVEGALSARYLRIFCC